VRHADTWGGVGCAIKGLDPRSVAAGEEWVAGPMTTVRNARLLAETLECLAAPGAPPRPVRTWARLDGQLVAQVFPTSLRDRAVFAGYRAEVWLEPGKPATQAAAYREHPRGQVSLVLGGGNVS